MVTSNTLKPNLFKPSSCYFEANHYGFKQKRIRTENVGIPTADESRDLVMKHILAPTDQGYGK